LKKLGLGLISLVAASAMLVACGGGGDASLPQVAATGNLSSNVNAATVGALSGESFNFANGVSGFGTNTATAVTLNTNTFSVASSQGVASGNLTFGSCIFTVTNSTFPAGFPLVAGARVEITPCSMSVTTGGLLVDANAATRAVAFILGISTSVARNLPVDVDANGVVTVNGVRIGTVTLTNATGATGGS